jgi:hypothetical protein
MILFSSLVVRYETPSLSTTFLSRLAPWKANAGVHTSGIASKSVSADDVGPRVLAQCAISQSHCERNGAHIESVGTMGPGSFTVALSHGPVIGAPGEPNGKWSTTTTPDSLASIGGCPASSIIAENGGLMANPCPGKCWGETSTPRDSTSNASASKTSAGASLDPSSIQTLLPEMLQNLSDFVYNTH